MSDEIAKKKIEASLKQIIKYLSSRLDRYPDYKEFIDKLEFLGAEIDKDAAINSSDGTRKFKQQALKIVNQYFATHKKQLWQEINCRKEEFLLGNNPDRVQKIINQIPHRCNRFSQNYVRTCKQNSNQHKLELVNPFICHSLMYRVQNIIQTAEVISQKEPDNIYLLPIVKQEESRQTIYTHVIELCEQSLTTWLDREWQKILTDYHQGGLEQLQKQLTAELEPIENLVTDTFIKQPDLKPQLSIHSHVELAALKNNSKIVFDYNYTHSTWFRLLVAIVIGSIVYLFSQRLFGFILLLVQIINLMTGQDTKSVRLRQQSKELKRVVDSKYQFLVRFLADKLTQDIAIAIDNINQSYQEQIELIIQEATQKLNLIKQENILTKEKIAELKQTHLKIQEIIEDNYPSS